ncbi:MAG: hypothetical protein LBH40_01425 [Alphaproteobacteria bacterium]|jgi:uncharacterized protein YceK|nr:hypothetical protein [Alphaproteobacteria bacterium]
MKKLVLALILMGILSGCSSNLEKPVGIGSGRDDLKKSPCACLDIYDYKKGGWL